MKEKFFGKHPSLIALPNLIELQLNSYRWFLEHGLKELFEEISPIRDWSGKELELYFVDYYLDEPKYDEVTAKNQNASFEAPLRGKLRLVNKKTGEVKEQEIYLGEFPLMTERGTFIVNGVERVIISQLIRSSGVFFTMAEHRGRRLFGAKIIPNRGAWLEFETDLDNSIGVKIDRKRKVPVTALIRAFLEPRPLSNEERIEIEKEVKKFKETKKFPEGFLKERSVDLARIYSDGMKEFKKDEFSNIYFYFTESKTKGEMPNEYAEKINKIWEDLIKEIKEYIHVDDRELKESLFRTLKVREKIEKERMKNENENERISKIFQDVDIHPDNKYIESTLKRDISKTKGEGFIEVYKRLRPGDLATVDNAQQMIEAMFFNFERYDLAKVGRWKFNQRLGVNTPLDKEHRILRLEDLVLVVKEIIKLNNSSDGQGDDIDHLANRRLRSIGELLQNKLRVGMARTERIIRDRMTTLDVATLTPAQLINARPFMAAVKEFFTTSQLSQFMDQVNPLAELEHKRRLSTMGPGGLTRERAGFEVRDVHPTYYGRICPIQTPEGPNIGLVGNLTGYTRLNEFGFLESPYRKVKNGKITNQVVYLDAFQEQKHDIAHAGVPVTKDGFLEDVRVEARVKGQASITKREKIDFMDVSPQECISIATSLIPFLEHDDANRALMGSNMQRQSVSCIKPQAPLVGTGVEKNAAFYSGQLLIAGEDGKVVKVDAKSIEIESALKDKKTGRPKRTRYELRNFMRTNQFTCINQRPLVQLGQSVKKGQVLADGAATDQGRLALGQNLLVAFIPWRGGNFEDAIIISEKLVRDDRFTSIHIEDFSCDVRETKLGPEVTTPDIPNVGEERLKDLDEEGIVRIGAEVGPNDILVGKISPKGEADLTAEERLLRAIFGDKARDVKDTSLRLPHGKRGRVIGIKIFSREKGDKLQSGVIKTIQVEVAQLRKIMVGDKLAGRHGNKGVIARILSQEDMPYLADGTPVDIILNPLGVASRMNIGQILETHLGWAAKNLGFRAITPALDGATEEEIKECLKQAGLPSNGKATLYDSHTGEPFPPVTIGYIYMMKLHHLVEDKIHMRSIGPYSLITQQPLGGKAQFGGQRFGEMEVWALEGYGAAYTLQEMLTIKSDDVVGRANAYDAIIRDQTIKAPNVPASFNVLVSELKALGLGVELMGVKKEDEQRE